MPSNRDDSPSASTLRAAAVELIAARGVAAVDAAMVCEVADVPAQGLQQSFGTFDELVQVVTHELCGQAVFPDLATFRRGSSARDVLRHLALVHRRYIDEHSDRYRAIVHLTAAAIFGRPELIAPIAARNVRARQAVAAHLSPLRTHGAIDPTADLALVASTFVDTVNGIEMCFLIDEDAVGREASYGEAVASLAALLDG